MPFAFTRHTDGPANKIFAAHLNELQQGVETLGHGVFNVMEPVDSAQSADYARGDGTTDDSGAFATADAANAGSGVTYAPPAVYRFAVGRTLANALHLPPGAVLQPDAGVTITLDGPLDAGPYPIFAGSGTVALGALAARDARAEWWGLSPAATAAANLAALQAACAALVAGGRLGIGAGTYALGAGTVTLPSGVALEGRGRGLTVLSWAGAGLNAPLLSLPPGTSDNAVRHLTVAGEGGVNPGNLTNQNGISPQGVDQTIEDVRVDGCNMVGISPQGSVRCRLRDVRVTNTLATSAGLGGVGVWVFRGNQDCQIAGLAVDGSDSHGLAIDSSTNSLGGAPNTDTVVTGLRLTNAARNSALAANGLMIKGAQRCRVAGAVIDTVGSGGNVAYGVYVTADQSGNPAQDVDVDAVVTNCSYGHAVVASGQHCRVRVGGRNVGLALPGTGNVYAAYLAYGSQDRTAADNALATATVGGGAVTAVTVTQAGNSYVAVPPVSFSGGGGSGAAATASIVLSGVTMVRGGSGYTAAPAVTLSGGGAAAQGTAHAVLNAHGGVQSIVLDSPGSGYTSQPTVTIAAPPAGGETAAGLATFGVASVAVTTGGSGYTSAPAVSLVPLPPDCTDNVIEVRHAQDSGVGELDYAAGFAVGGPAGGATNNCQRNVVRYAGPAPAHGWAYVAAAGTACPTSGANANRVAVDGQREGTAGVAPTATALGGAGSGAPAPQLLAGSTDEAGVVQWGTGSAPTVGNQVKVTFAVPYQVPPLVLVEGSSPNSKYLGVYWYRAGVADGTGFIVAAETNAPTAGEPVGTYEAAYRVIALGS